MKPIVNFLNRPGVGISIASYEKHTLKPIYYEVPEAEIDMKDEMSLKMRHYVEALDDIENGILDPQRLGIKL